MSRVTVLWAGVGILCSVMLSAAILFSHRYEEIGQPQVFMMVDTLTGKTWRLESITTTTDFPSPNTPDNILAWMPIGYASSIKIIDNGVTTTP
jgi:hypothetical protein